VMAAAAQFVMIVAKEAPGTASSDGSAKIST